MNKKKLELIKKNPYTEINQTKLSMEERNRLIREAIQKYPYVPLEVIGEWFGGITRERISQITGRSRRGSKSKNKRDVFIK